MRKTHFGQLIIISLLILMSSNVMAGVKTRRVEVDTRWGLFKAEIHYREHERTFARRVEEILIKDTPALFDYFRYVPRNTVQFSTEDDPSSANGLATVLYGNRITLNNFPPHSPGHLSYSGDWPRLLVIHELTHIIHMDQTRGFPNIIRSIFGFVGKWNGIAPTWFMEGVAVWAESNFAGAGRLYNKKMRYEFDATLLDGDYCNTIDCLDNPGVYPYRQYAYWAGAYFIEFLEEKFPGTIRCMVTDNSYYLPGFLGQVFINCLKMPAGGLFELFKRERLKKLASLNAKPYSFNKVNSTDDGSIYWQKGYSLIGNRLFVSKRDLAREYFVEIDLNSGISSRFDFDYLIDHIPVLSDYSQRDESIPLVLFTVSGEDYLRHGELWKARKQKVQEEIDLEEEEMAHYIFDLDGGRRLIIRNDGGLWNLLINDQLITTIDNLGYPMVVGDKLWIRNFRLGRGFRLLTHSLKKNRPWKVVYRSNAAFELFDSLGSGVLVRTEAGKLERITLKGDNSNIATFTPPWASQLVDLRESKGELIALLEGYPGTIFRAKSSAFEKELNGSWASTRNMLITVDEIPPKKIEKKEEESYPSLRHFMPQGWYFTSISGEKSSYFGGYTEFQDPRGYHTFGLGLRYYDTYKEYAPTISYLYNLGGGDRLYLSGSYSEEYSWNSYAQRKRRERSSNGRISWRLPIGRWESLFSLQVERSDFDNLSTVIVQKQYSVTESLSYSSLFENAFIHDFLLYGQGSQYESDGFLKFYGLELKSKLGLRLHRRFELTGTFNWGKLFKDTIYSGFLEAGEKQGTFYHVYGVEYSDIFGLNVATARAQFNWNLIEVFGGSGMLPIFIQRVYLFGGVDTFKAQYFYYDGQFRRDKTLSTAHAGLRLEGVVGFYLPVTMELSFAQLMAYKHDTRTSVSFILGY